MTQAYNLAILANAVNTSGQLNVGTNATGTLPLANGGTGTTNTVNTVVAGTGISVSTSGTQVTVSASGSGTVTSVATGNGLQGGTITTSGTLSVACPSFNTVGSYAWVGVNRWNNGVPSFLNIVSGNNYSAGGGATSVQSGAVQFDGATMLPNYSNNLSGTWKWMGYGNNDNNSLLSLGCRVS